ncbi:hypothetical protein [Actinocrispum sp. NPDC049592]|uniref:SMP-30/gluconolactonase/LRE family protein n=1 Tax=Actinocrispum sp. NPDC049592 TaxID=3154835 RepID=UPI0034190A54
MTYLKKTLAVTAAAMVALTAPAAASQTRTLAHFDIAQGQLPENITLEPDGSADVTWAAAGQVARVRPDGHVEVLTNLPAGGRASGIVRSAAGTIYFLHFGGGLPAGVYQIKPGQPAELYTALPDTVFPNGLALDGYTLYLTDSSTGTIWRVRHRQATKWLTAPILAPSTPSGFGVNGIKLHGGAVWVSQTEKGLLLRIPVRSDGSPGAIQTKAQVTGIDDFTFGHGDEVFAANNFGSEVVLLHPNGSQQTFLTAQDGLSNPTSIAVRGNKVYVANAAYFTQKDPNVLVAKQ